MIKLAVREKTRGFTAVEIVLAVAVIAILVTILVVRLGNNRQDAIQARTGANLNMIQGAYERAKLLCPDVLSNNVDNVGQFANDARTQGLLNRTIETADLDAIGVATNTTISGMNAMFYNKTPGTNNTVGVGAPLPPSVAITAPANGQTLIASQPVTVLVTAQAVGGTITKVEIFADATLLNSKTSPPWSFSVLVPEGTQNLRAKAYTASASAVAAVSVTVNPNSPPTVSWNAPAAGTYPFNAVFSLSASASDPDGTISRLDFLNGAAILSTVNGAGPFGYEWTPGPGSYDVYARAYDNLNAPGESPHAAITVADNAAPQLSLTSPTDGMFVTNGVSLTIQGFVTDEENVTLVLQANSAAVQTNQNVSGSFGMSWTPVTSGNSTLAVTATDPHGIASTRTVTVAVQPGPLPTVALSPTNNTTFPSGSITLSATATDPRGRSITSVTLYVDDLPAYAVTGNSATLSTNLNIGTHKIYASALGVAGAGYSSTNFIQVLGSQTVLLLHMDDGTFSDSSSARVATGAGVNASCDTTIKKIGAGSYKSSAASTGVQFHNSALVLNTNDYTLEAWIYPTDWPAVGMSAKVIDTRDYDLLAMSGPFFQVNAGGVPLAVEGGGATSIYSATPIALNTWTHLALTRTDGTVRFFVNGTLAGSGSSSLALNSSAVIIGARPDRVQAFMGNIDEVRIVNGKALYTGSFTPPTSPLPAN